MAPRSTLRARDLPPLLARFLGAGALVSASVCALDVLLGGGGPLALLHALGLGVTLGAGLGLALGLPVLLLSLAGVRLLRLASLLGGGVLGFLWASSFGAVDRLFGAYARMAIVVVIGCVLGWMCFGFFLGLTPPRSRGGRFGEGAARRSVLLALFIAAALAVSIIDRFGPSMSVYPVARRGLELLGLGSMLLAWLWIARPVPARLRRFGLIAALIVAPLPLLSLPATPSVALHPLATRPFTALALAMLRETIDLDGDGYSGVLGGGDCAPLDPARHPSARDRPGNGVDEDCIGGDLAPEPQAPIPSPASAPASPSPSSLVLITVDSLRPDFLGAYGHRAGTTPRLDAWAEGAVRFERAYTSAGWTSMALSSLFRGLYPRHLRWQLVFETAGYRLLLEGAPPLQEGERINHGFLLPIGDPHPTLPDLLAARGMQTAAVVDDGETDFLSPEAGIFGSFEHLETLDALPPERRDDARVADRAIARLEALSEGGPFFLWVHFFGPHLPDATHPGLPSYGEGSAARYDHEIAFLDREQGRLLDAIEALDRPVATIYTSDHGERIWATGRGHGLDLEPQSLLVPLLIKAPGWAPALVPQPVSLIDIVPTLLALSQTPAPPGLDGLDLARLLEEPPPARLLLADLWRFDAHGHRVFDEILVFDEGERLHLDRLSGALSATDGELRPIDAGPVLRGPKGALLERYRSSNQVRPGWW